MSACTNCGTETVAQTKFCGNCGTTLTSSAVVTTPSAPTIEVMPPPPTWYVTFATGQRGGPFSEDQVRSMIASQQIKITDSVVMAGGSNWVPITQSPFARHIASQASVDRLAASTCPRCGAAMAVVSKRSTMGTLLIFVRIITSIALIGIVLIIIGLGMRRKLKVSYQCPRCNYRT